MESNKGLLSLPDDILSIVFKFLNQDDKLSLSSANKRLRDLYMNMRGKKFHIQGNTERLFSYGLKFLLGSKIKYSTLKISYFNLLEVLDKKLGFLDYNFNEYVEWFLGRSYSCDSINELDLNECVVTDKSLVNLRKMFPKLEKLSLSRCIMTTLNDDRLPITPTNREFNPLITLTLPMPFQAPVAADNGSPVFLDWLLQNFTKDSTEVKFSVSTISKKRAVYRRFLASRGKSIEDHQVHSLNVILSSLRRSNLQVTSECRNKLSVDLTNL